MPNRADKTDAKLREKSITDSVKGKVNELVGKGRGELGDLTDDRSEQIRGKIQETKGKIQQKKGKIEGQVATKLSDARARDD